MSQRSRYDEKKKIEESLKKKSYEELSRKRERIYNEIEEKSKKREINLKIFSTTVIWGIGISSMVYFSSLGVGDVGGVILSGLGSYGLNKFITPSIKKEDIEKKLLENNRELLKMLDNEINRKRNLEHILEYDPIGKGLESDNLLEEFLKKEVKPKTETSTIPKKNIPIEDSIFAPSLAFQKKKEPSKVSLVEETRKRQEETINEKPKKLEKISTKIVSPSPEKKELTEKEKEELRKNMAKVKPYVSSNPGDPFRNYGPQKSTRPKEKTTVDKDKIETKSKPSNSYKAKEPMPPEFDEIMRIFNGIDDENKPKTR